MNRLQETHTSLGLSIMQKKVLMFYSKENADDYCVDDEYSYTFGYMSDCVGLNKKEVRLACRALTRKGLFQLNNCISEENLMQGRHYGITFKGIDFLEKYILDNKSK